MNIYQNYTVNSLKIAAASICTQVDYYKNFIAFEHI
jgi:hypothetical protein